MTETDQIYFLLDGYMESIILFSIVCLKFFIILRLKIVQIQDLNFNKKKLSTLIEKLAKDTNM